MVDDDVIAPWRGFLDDAGILPDRAAIPSYDSPLVGLRVVHQDDLPRLVGYRRPLRVEVSGASGLRVVRRALDDSMPVVAVTAVLQDPADPVANVRRFLHAARGVEIPEEVRLHVAVQGPPLGSWLRTADEVAAVEGALVLDLEEPELAGWIEAALDRELPFALRRGSLGDAVEALRATAGAWGDPADLVGARRWCRAWACRDVPAAITVLKARP